MLIMTQDRVSGLSSDKSPLKSYGPGNTRDESNRNSWVSSETVDKLDISCFSQVSGLFLGRYQADKVLLTYKGSDIYDSKTPEGFISVGYSLGSSGQINGVLSEVITGDSSYYYNGGSILRIECLQEGDSRQLNVNDFIEAASSNSSLNSIISGGHRIIAVHTDNIITKLDDSLNSVLNYSDVIRDSYYIHVLDSVSPSLIGENVSITSGIIENLTIGSGILRNWNDVEFYYDIDFSYPRSSRFVNDDTPYKTGEVVSFDGVELRRSDGTLVEDMSTNLKFYPIVAHDEASLSFTVRVYRTAYDFVNPSNEILNIFMDSSGGNNSYIKFGTSLFFYGNGFRHGLGIQDVNAFVSNVETNFLNNEVVSLEGFNSKSNSALSYIFDFNRIDDKFFIKSFIKDRESFSVKTPFYISPSDSFLENENRVISIRKYVLDTVNASTTNAGVGTPIRRSEITTRVASSLSGFVTGEITKVESNYIPLPREGYDSKIIIEMESNINHNRSGLFKEFLLEELEVYVGVDKIVVNKINDLINSSGPLFGKTYKTNISTFSYNENNDGILNLYASSSSHGIEAGDRVYLNFETNYYSTNITLPISSFDSGLNQYTMSANVEDVYEGMRVQNGGNNFFVSSINYSNNTLILSSSIGITSGSLVFEHHNSFSDSVLDSLNRVQIVDSVDGQYIKIYAPNVSVHGDMTLNNQYSCAGTFLAKVGYGKGRFVRSISEDIEKSRYFLWNSNESTDITYTINSKDYIVEPGRAYVIFDGSHNLVNNDKIIFYNYSEAVGGAENIYGFKSSYLIEYAESNAIEFSIEKSRTVPINQAVLGNNSLDELVFVTDSDHGLSVSEVVSITGTGSHIGNHQIHSVPTSKSFVIKYESNFSSGYTVNSGNVITGIHYLSSFSSSPQLSGSLSGASSPIENLICSRSVSIQDASNSYENSISVGNHVFIDGYFLSSGEYNSVVGNGKFSKTPTILDSVSSQDWRSDSNFPQRTFLGPSGSLNCQIEVVRGDATDFGDVKLVNAFGKLESPIQFTSLLNAIRIAIIRAGVSRQLPNPQVGVTNALKDFSVRKELPTGAYYYLNRDSAKEFSGKLISDPESVDRLIDFGTTQLAKPFPCLIISGNKGNMKKLRTRTALYGYFTSLPTATYSNKLYNLKEASFNIREVL